MKAKIYSYKKVAELLGVTKDRIYKICKRVPNLSYYDENLKLKVITKEGFKFIKSRVGKRGKKLEVI